MYNSTQSMEGWAGGWRTWIHSSLSALEQGGFQKRITELQHAPFAFALNSHPSFTSFFSLHMAKKAISKLHEQLHHYFFGGAWCFTNILEGGCAVVKHHTKFFLIQLYIWRHQGFWKKAVLQSISMHVGRGPHTSKLYMTRVLSNI